MLTLMLYICFIYSEVYYISLGVGCCLLLVQGSPEPQCGNINSSHVFFINTCLWEQTGKIQLKMKTFRLVGMAILAMIMCVNFVSCKDDEPDGGENGNLKEKKLVKIEEQYSDYTESYTYKYDKDNRLSSLLYKYGESEDDMSETIFEYLSNSIEEKEDDYLDVKYIYDTNINNRISKMEKPYGMNGDVLLSYDENFNLIETKSTSEEDYYYKLTWNNDNIVKLISDRGLYDITYTNNENKNLSFALLAGIEDFMLDSPLFYVHPELGGIKTKNLVEKITYNENSETTSYSKTYSYSYEFDKDGYVTRIKIIESDGDESGFKLYWE